MIEIIRNEKVVCRKPTRCWGCMRRFPKGTTIEKTTSVDGGRILTTPWCATCLAMMRAPDIDWWDYEETGWCEGAMVEDWRDGFADYMYRTEYWPS